MDATFTDTDLTGDVSSKMIIAAGLPIHIPHFQHFLEVDENLLWVSFAKHHN
jgi:hypothetical protein